MASIFMIGTTADSLESLDELTTPLPDPQWDFRQYGKATKLANLAVRSLGFSRVLWNFPMIEPAQVAQLETFKANETIFIQSLKRDDTEAVFEVLMNWNDPGQDGSHKAGFKGWRFGLELEMLILSEVEAS